ncbi:hypothetical protein D4R99_04650 [bacterium]|nr:MAG: hypothetical protein D4R99_04650 [bacterium]
MKKRTFVIFTSYIWLKTLIGLTFHPYKLTRETVKHPIVFPVIFSPLIGVVILFLAARIASMFIMVYGITRDMVALFLSTTLISLLFWQLLLIYFLINFLTAHWKNN